MYVWKLHMHNMACRNRKFVHAYNIYIYIHTYICIVTCTHYVMLLLPQTQHWRHVTFCAKGPAQYHTIFNYTILFYYTILDYTRRGYMIS